MPQHVECRKCKFTYCDKLDIETREMSCVCLSCLSNYVIVHNPTHGTMSYGARVGECLNIWHVVDKDGKQVITNQSVKIVEGEKVSLDGGIVFDTVKYLIEEVSCPHCDQFTLSIGFDEGDSCPKCHKRTLSFEFVEP